MRIETSDDPVAGTVTVAFTFPVQADPDRMADVAWEAVERAATGARRRAGTVPDGLAAPVS